MSFKHRVIVLAKVEYGDRTLIVDCFSAESGRISASTHLSKKNKSLFYYSPLNVIELDLFRAKKSKLFKVKEAKSLIAEQLANQSPEVNAYRFFIAEFLQKTIEIESQDRALYKFLTDQIASLYHSSSRPSFLSDFLEQLSPFLGIDLAEIKAQGGEPSDYGLLFNDQEWKTLMEQNKVKEKERLSALLKFYAHHFPAVEKLKSRKVLSAVFR